MEKQTIAYLESSEHDNVQLLNSQRLLIVLEAYGPIENLKNS